MSASPTPIARSRARHRYDRELRRSTLPQFNAVVVAHNAATAAEAALEAAVLRGRLAGLAWSQIADILGVNIWAAKARFPEVKGRGGPGPMRLPRRESKKGVGMQQIGTCVVYDTLGSYPSASCTQCDWAATAIYEDDLARRVAEHSRVHAREDHGVIVDRAEFESKAGNG